jgi:hypothetical protein
LHISDSAISLVGCLFAAVYLTCISGLILRSRHDLDGLLLLLAGLSAAPWMAMQVGNNDLLIFSLVFLGCVVSTAGLLGPSLFFVATALKVYPIAPMMMWRSLAGPERKDWPLWC